MRVFFFLVLSFLLWACQSPGGSGDSDESSGSDPVAQNQTPTTNNSGNTTTTQTSIPATGQTNSNNAQNPVNNNSNGNGNTPQLAQPKTYTLAECQAKTDAEPFYQLKVGDKASWGGEVVSIDDRHWGEVLSSIRAQKLLNYKNDYNNSTTPIDPSLQASDFKYLLQVNFQVKIVGNVEYREFFYFNDQCVLRARDYVKDYGGSKEAHVNPPSNDPLNVFEN